jgi:hypothetical protein
VESDIFESAEERRRRYIRMAIAAAAAAARAPLPEVRMAYLLVAESWSNLAKSEDVLDPTADHEGSATPAENGLPTDIPH